MKLNVKAMMFAGALMWGVLCMFGVGLLGMIWPGYGQSFLAAMASIYPGYHPGGFGQAVLGGAYGLIDGGIGGLVFAWLYNCFAK